MSDNTSTLAPSAPAPALPEPGSLVARLVGVIFSPRATFAKLVPKAPWLGALAVVTLLTAGGQYAFLSTEVGQEAMVDQQIHQAELRNGGNINQQTIDTFEGLKTKNRYIVAVSILIVGPIMTFVFAGIYFGVFNALLGGDASYKQVLAIVTHSGAVNVSPPGRLPHLCGLMMPLVFSHFSLGEKRPKISVPAGLVARISRATLASSNTCWLIRSTSSKFARMPSSMMRRSIFTMCACRIWRRFTTSVICMRVRSSFCCAFTAKMLTWLVSISPSTSAGMFASGRGARSSSTNA